MDEKPEITEAYFERVFNLGNYETCRIGLKATIGPDQDAGGVVAALDRATVDMRNAHRHK
jgi:hypothetical protein